MKTTPHDPEPLEHAPPEDVQRAQEKRLLSAWKTPTGWRYWSAVNNSEVGLWYTTAAFCFFLFGGVLALLIRIQLAVPDNTFLSAELYNQIFTLAIGAARLRQLDSSPVAMPPMETLEGVSPPQGGTAPARDQPGTGSPHGFQCERPVADQSHAGRPDRAEQSVL